MAFLMLRGFKMNLMISQVLIDSSFYRYVGDIAGFKTDRKSVVHRRYLRAIRFLNTFTIPAKRKGARYLVFIETIQDLPIVQIS